ncbi:hypothetical protein BKA65DRAFT_274098 [Rhexocercosporidium sp. MPI-PUGE-AT-0058]|nr:hypothetical protein BKA65DRAFT_274098 [Rhexocercosporidium sp. MPI-PUGE-AT-0058]
MFSQLPFHANSLCPKIHISTGFVILLLSVVCFGQRFGNSSFDAEYPGVSTACGATLNPQLSCDDVLAEIAWESRYLQTKQLSSLCVETCVASMRSARSNIVGACTGTNDVIVESGLAYPATFVLDHLINAWQTTCRKDVSSSQYCNLIFQQWINQTVMPAGAECSDCMLGTGQIALGSPVGYSDDFASDFAASTSSCGKTNYAYSTPTSFALNGTGAAPTAAPTPACLRPYTVSSGDSCASIASANSISTFGLYVLNSLDVGCTNFPQPGSTICLPSSCTTYTVQPADTCLSIIRQTNDVTIVQLQSWNPNLNRQCSNLQDYDNTTICITAPFDIADSSPNNTNPVQSTFTTQAPIPTDIVDGTNTYCGKYHDVVAGDQCGLLSTQYGISLQDFSFLNPEVDANCTNLFLDYSYCVAPVGVISTYANYSGHNPTAGPCATVWAPSSCHVDLATMTPLPFMDANYTFSAAPTASNTATLPSPFPLAPDTRNDCFMYRDYLTSSDAATETELNSCSFLTFRYRSSKSDLLAWNPSLSSSTCALVAGLKYCVVLNDPDITSATTTSATPTSTGITVPGPTQAGIISTCNRYVLQQTNVYCQDMADNAGISLSELYAWNPALGGDCSGLWGGYAYCIGVTISSTTTSGPSEPTSTCTGTAPPKPTQAGISCSCNSWLEQKEGVYCAEMATSAGISLQKLYDLNPALNGDCSGLWGGYAYCVGLTGGTSASTTTTAAPPENTCAGGTSPPETTQPGIPCKCNRWVEQQDGIYCYDMAATAGISLSALYSLNPGLNGDCSGLWAGYAYCVGLAS